MPEPLHSDYNSFLKAQGTLSMTTVAVSNFPDWCEIQTREELLGRLVADLFRLQGEGRWPHKIKRTQDRIAKVREFPSGHILAPAHYGYSDPGTLTQDNLEDVKYMAEENFGVITSPPQFVVPGLYAVGK